jgi:hypothetical protein
MDDHTPDEVNPGIEELENAENEPEKLEDPELKNEET